MAVSDWIDTLAAVWEVPDPEGREIHSYRMYSSLERAYAFPEIITEFPSVLNYTVSMDPEYSHAGPQMAYWLGVSEFHCTPSVDKEHYPYVMDFFEIIYRQAAANFTLGGIVKEFHILRGHPNGPSIRGPVQLTYGDEAPHLGLIVNWFVKEQIVSEINFGTGE